MLAVFFGDQKDKVVEFCNAVTRDVCNLVRCSFLHGLLLQKLHYAKVAMRKSYIAQKLHCAKVALRKVALRKNHIAQKLHYTKWDALK